MSSPRDERFLPAAIHAGAIPAAVVQQARRRLTDANRGVDVPSWMNAIPEEYRAYVERLIERSYKAFSDRFTRADFTERFSQGWVEKQLLFEEIMGENGLRRVDTLDVEDRRPMAALTMSASFLIATSPKAGTRSRSMLYSRLPLRQGYSPHLDALHEVPFEAEFGGALAQDQPIVVSGVINTSPAIGLYVLPGRGLDIVLMTNTVTRGFGEVDARTMK